MPETAVNLVNDFIKDYDDEHDHNYLGVGAESYSIGDVDDLVHNPTYHLSKSAMKILEDIWNDREDGKTLLGVDSRSDQDVDKLRKIVNNSRKALKA